MIFSFRPANQISAHRVQDLTQIPTAMINDIEKESIEGLRFPNEELHLNGETRAQLRQELDRASTLGNIKKHKVRILFEDLEGKKSVITTIWGVTGKTVILKGGRSIPVHRIHSISFT